MINGIEIFSGAGGLATGLSLSGISHNVFVEWNSDACETLRHNYASDLVHEGDIRNFNFKNLSSIDFIAGGPPCQPFSIGGKAKGFDDQRDMFPEAIRSIRELAPKAFVFENVKGLLRASFNDYLQYILLQLRYPEFVSADLSWQEHYLALKKLDSAQYHGLKYDVSLTLVNAADYGVPQKRERIIIVGIRKDLGLSWKFPAQTHSLDSLLWEKYVTESYWSTHNIFPSNEEYKSFPAMKELLIKKYGLFPPSLLPWRTIRDALQDIPEENGMFYYPNEHLERKGAREYPGHTGSPIDEPSKTIKAGNHGVPGGENMVKLPTGEVRYYTIFEAKRLQTFPDDYAITGSWSEAMRQIGNAVPVDLAKVIGTSLIDTVFK